MVRHLLRLPGARRLWTRFPIGSTALRAQFDIWCRPHYGFGVWEAADLAQMLGLPRITVCEFGVAAGNGLIALEKIAEETERATGVGIDVAGFDSGQGLPAPKDYRDVPHFWATGTYKMDQQALRSRLRRAQLVLGDVAVTVPEWLNSGAAPVGFLAFDLDYYSSTVSAFRIFEGAPSTRLPRTLCYFDDVIYPEKAFLNEYIGEELAIREFNERSERMKLCRIRGLSYIRESFSHWHDQMYCLHDFDHPLYTVNVHPDAAVRRAAHQTAGR